MHHLGRFCDAVRRPKADSTRAGRGKASRFPDLADPPEGKEDTAGSANLSPAAVAHDVLVEKR